MHSLTLTPPARPQQSTTIQIGSGLTESLKDHLPLTGIDRVVVLFDHGVAAITKRAAASLNQPVMIEVPSGDGNKSMRQAEQIAEALLKAGCTRSTLFVCIGGGMLTDLGGFVASVFMRGIPCALVPTSLLAMVDAAIGGKTGINVGDRKNMLGTLTHPATVIIDTDLLKDLPDAQLKEGLVEAIKIGAIADAVLFGWFEENLDSVLARDPMALEQAVVRSVQAKVQIVESDEHDRKERLLLNFGHTVGHAVEALSNYAVSHGQAVAIGMAAEMQLAGCKQAKRVLALLKKLALPTALPADQAEDALWQAMLVDKKNSHGTVRIAVPETIGSGVVLPLTREQFSSLFP